MDVQATGYRLQATGYRLQAWWVTRELKVDNLFTRLSLVTDGKSMQIEWLKTGV
jgi:hypothetical protein